MQNRKSKVLQFLIAFCVFSVSTLQSQGIDQILNKQILVEFKNSRLQEGVALKIKTDSFLFDPIRESPIYDPEPRWLSLADVKRIFFPDGTMVYGTPEKSLKAEKKAYPTYAPVVAVICGMVFGPILGATIGASAPKDYSEQVFENMLNGALIGMTLMPFVSYEIVTTKMGVTNAKNSWIIYSGANAASSNHSGTIPGIGYAIGLNRSYYLQDHLNLVAGVSYNMRTFDLHDQRVYFPWSGLNPEIRRQNMTFAVGYVDVQLAPQVNYRKADLFFGGGIGVAASARVYEKTRRTTLSIEHLDDWTWPPPEYDFYHVSDEPESSMPYFALVATTELEWKKIIVRFSFKKAFKESRQMSPLKDETQLKTIELSFGYLF